MIKKKTLKSILSLVIIFTMTFGVFPWSDLRVAFAEPQITKIEVMKIYSGNYNLPTSYNLAVHGNDLTNLETFIQGADGLYTRLTASYTGVNLAQYSLSTSQAGATFLINGQTYVFDASDMPEIKSVSPAMVVSEGNLTVVANNLNNIKTTPEAGDTTLETIKVFYYQGLTEQDISSYLGIPATDPSTEQPKVVPTTTGLGIQNLKVLKKYVKPIDTGSVEVEISYRYIDAFSIYKEITEIDAEDINMNPTKGKRGDKVTLTTEDFPEDYSVFLTDQANEPFRGKHLGKNIIINRIANLDDTITFNIPDTLDFKTYDVYITNYINPAGIKPEDNLSKLIVKRLFIGKFTVVDGAILPQIQSVQPNSGPDSGSEVKINGKFFEELNIDKLEGFKDSGIDVTNPVRVTVEKRNELQQLKIMYEPTNGTAGTYEGKPAQVTRYISVIIGREADFRIEDLSKQIFKYGANQFDTLTVLTKGLGDDGNDLIKDVIVNIETVIKEGTNEYTIKEQATANNAYTYIKTFTEPIIDTLIPNVVSMKEVNPGEYQTANEVILALSGKDFHVYKHTPQTGDNANKELVMYPKVVLGGNDDNGEIVITRVSDVVTIKHRGGTATLPGAYLEVLNAQDKLMDGTVGNEVGSKIILRIPSGLTIAPEKVNASLQGIGVANAMRGSEDYGLYTLKSDMIKFVSTLDVPVIEEVKPNVVTVDGGEDIVIIGTNFASDVKVFIDGKEVTGIKRNGIGTQIDFKSPKGREGDTLVYVLNPTTGGVATYPYKYVRTYTNPKIIDFSPKKGKTGTLVVIDGENFVKPDPTALEKDIFKLIGARVMLEGKDINEYYRHPVTRQITLQEYTAGPSGQRILTNVGGNLILANYYNSIILQNEDTQRFYTLDKDVLGNVILTNGIDQKFIIKADGSGSNIKAEKDGGGTFTVIAAQHASGDYDQMILSDGTTTLTLKVMTPFIVQTDTTTNNRTITGNNVKVMGIDKIYFTVPVLPGDGYYDVTVENPDTKKDTKKDQAGFYYYTQPSSKPKIDKVEPKEGSVDGGYIIKIFGIKELDKECFVDNGVEKTKVFINGIEVPQAQINVALSGDAIEAVVPKLNIDIRAKYGTDRLTVPVVVVNPDGGSDSLENGFTYIVPTSHPEIIKIVPQKGSAAGEEIVEITGKDFRFYEPYNDANRDQVWNPSPKEEYRDINGVYFNGTTFITDDGTKGPDDYTGKSLSDLRVIAQNSVPPRDYDKVVLSVLPKVYFGTAQAEILEFSSGYLKVRTPKGKAGDVDVYVVNNDAGISNRVKYSYEGSNPKIDKIIPSEGKKQGGDKVEVNGQGFIQSDIKKYRKNGTTYDTVSVKQTLVRLGNIYNKDIPREQLNSGRIDNSRATVNLAGSLTVSYNGENASNTKLTLSIVENQVNYSVELPYNNEAVYIPVSLLTNPNLQSYVSGDRGDEWIRVEVSDRRLFVERGYAPAVEFINGNQIVVHTPSYHTVGQVSLTVINPDGGTAEGKFTYKNPSSRPTIVNITKDGRNPSEEAVGGVPMKILRLTYKGGNIVSVMGTDFRENATIKIGDILDVKKEQINYQLPSKMTFTMPAVDEKVVGKRYRVVVSNEDGGNAASDASVPPIYIEFIKGETEPAIEEITPAQGPSSGGTTVIIKGKDFREGLLVFFGDTQVPTANVKVIDYKTIQVITPPRAPGEVEVKIENPDGALSSANGTFTYLSTPTVVAVVDPADPSETARISVISILGGQEIKLKGTGYYEGAKVIFNPVLEEVKAEAPTGNVIYLNGKPYILKQGAEGSDVKIIDGETLTVKTPPGKKDTGGVIVVNADGGASNVYGDIKYGVPELAAPSGVIAELVYDRYIKVNWNPVTDAKEYEIFVVINENVQEVIGTTELTAFVYEDLEPKTSYKFIVKAIGEFGSSKASNISNTVRTGSKVGPPDNDGSLGEQTQQGKNGDRAEVTIGTKEDLGKDFTIDLTKGSLAGSKEVVISIPASVVADAGTKSIVVNGQDFRIKLNPNSFYNDKVRENRDKQDAGVRIEIGPTAEGVTTAGTNGQTGVSTAYAIKAAVFVGKDRTEIEYIRSSIQVTLDVDRVKADARKLKSFALNRYDGYEGKWVAVAAGNADSMAITALTDRLGKFMILGRR
ncbi:MAG: cell surface receptor protein [Anaerosolibacter sp.]|jgi:hypothetical protein|uniref:IPT/TIG domain-containing protein n=1 Tax=Anaerosolibacter sp. TaxID=1872527 RepID=UPI00262B71C5|nr:IPT/TIG domain-containing protein [Anaerosolibacter sp.]MDF2545608.1 cell surface receptor protein [Anaerosolibacter sp.]